MPTTNEKRINIVTIDPRQSCQVLFVGKRFYTNRDAFEEEYGRIYQLPKYWAKAGIKTHLWLVDYHSRQMESRVEGALSVLSLPIRSMTGLFRLLTNSFWKKLTVTHVVASGDCYIGLLANLIAQRVKATFVFDIYDKYDEFSGYRRIASFDLFRYVMEQADHRMFASWALMEQLALAQGNGFVVPNGIDCQRFYPLDMQQSRAQNGLAQDIKYIGYFGSMEPDRGVADLIAAVMLLRDKGVMIELLIGGRTYPEIDVSGPGIRYLGNVPYEQMPSILCSCDLLAVPYRRSPFMDAGASNKIAEALAFHKPIVATRTPNLVKNYQEAAEQLAGRLAEPGNVADIARVIRLQLIQPIVIGLPDQWDWESIALNAARQIELLPSIGTSAA